MTEIIPAVLPKDYEDLKNKIALVRGLVPVVQLDICDGIFVPSTTWPFLSDGNLDEHFRKIQNEEEGMPFWEDIDFELDLMVSDSIENFDLYAKLGARRIIFHLEAVGDLGDFRNFLEGMDSYMRDTVEVGVAFKPSFDLEKLYPMVSLLDFVQFMGNDRISYQGVTLDEKVYDKIRALRAKYPDLPMSIDIGVNRETAPKLVAAGLTRLTAGSAIFGASDIMEAIEYFRNL